MISTRFVKLAVSGLAIGLALTGGHAGPATSTASPSEAKQLALAAQAAADATAALGVKNIRVAVASAEIAVTYSPRDPAYRLLLGQAYLSAGRFTSAETSFSDTLTLTPNNGRAALNLVLTEIAQGKRAAALTTLADYRDKIAASDFGLAVGLAGDAEAAVNSLEAAIRGGATDVKTRQNLALAYALAGRWDTARVMASQDLAQNDVDKRMAEWAEFVRPASSYDQVASLLNVRAVQDAGQPAHLALNALPNNVALAAAEPVEAVRVAEPVDAPIVAVAVEAPVVVAEAPAAFETAANTKAEAPVIRAAQIAVKQVIVPAPARRVANIAERVSRPTFAQSRSVTSGKFVVQLGAFQNAAVSRNSWGRLAPRFGLTGFDPANSLARVNGANYVRLSVGGFANRSEANYVCTKIRNAGGSCFVRGVLGDTPAQWVQRGMPKVKGAKAVQMAAR